MAGIVSDTGPINYLVRLGRIEILGVLFEKVFIPLAVAKELLDPRAPQVVRAWMENPPEWVEAGRVIMKGPSNDLRSKLRRLGPGETEAISRAHELGMAVILDDLEARTVAEDSGVPVVGTLGILAEAHNRALLDYWEEVEKLRTFGFHGSARVVHRVFEAICSQYKPQ